MARSDIPFNVDLLELTPRKLEGLRPVRVLDIFDGASGNFHPDGLFSVLIFGKVGDERRSRAFSYIDIKVPILHPIIYRTLVQLKRLYAGIVAGNEYAVWNDETKDFERSDAIAGKTGYAFFIEHWNKIEFEQSKSTQREQNILLIKKYRDTGKALTSKVVVMPAGLRDLEVDGAGRIREDEINTLYRRILSIANTISDSAVKTNVELLNTARYTLQQTFTELFESIESMIEGKKKLLMGKWASRRIMNGTRNVITAMDPAPAYLGAPGSIRFNDTVIGLYQAMKSTLPVALYHLRSGFLSTVFQAVDQPALLVNKKTLKAEPVRLKPYYFDRYMTGEGLEKVITSFNEESVRHHALEIEGHYLGLIYKGPDHTFRLLHDIDEVPEGRSKADVHPLTFCELLYLSVYRVINNYPTYVTRYPVTGMGSIYPSKMFVKTTIRSEKRRELGEDWTPMDESHVAYEFPLTGGPFVNSLSPHPAKLGGLGADFDGDTASANSVYSDEAIAEVEGFFMQKRAYVGTDGRLKSSTNVSTVQLVMHNMTSD
jgi:hypothetical protein